MEILPVQATYWAPQPWALTLGRQVHLAGWRASETNRRALGSLDSAGEEHAHVCLLPKQGREGELKLYRLLAYFPQLPGHTPQPELSDCTSLTCFKTQFHTGARAAMTKERVWLFATQAAQTQRNGWAGQGQPLLALTQAVHQKHPVSDGSQIATAHPSACHSPPKCLHQPVFLQY